MLYRRTEKIVQEASSFIVDLNPGDAVDENYDNVLITYTLLSIENVTISEIVQGIQRHLEWENHHHECRFVDFLVKNLVTNAGDLVTKEILISMIKERGLSIGL